MNYFVTHALNQLTGLSVFLDAAIFVFAEMIPWFVGFVFFIFIVFSFKRTIKPFIFSLFVSISSVVVNAGLKIFFNIQRPFEIYQSINPLFITHGFGSFPSSHAFFFAVLTTLSFFFLRRIFLFFLITSSLVGLARIMAGVHFFYDIVAGWFLGFVFAYIAIIFYKKSIGNEDESSANS